MRQVVQDVKHQASVVAQMAKPPRQAPNLKVAAKSLGSIVTCLKPAVLAGKTSLSCGFLT